jgi:hypothetical protein
MQPLMCNKSYNKAKWTLLLLGCSFLFAAGCNTAEKLPADSHVKVMHPWIFSPDFQKVVYKTNLLVYGNDLSGLTVIKKSDSSFRVVMMSEIGLKYFDMEFFRESDRLEVHHIINFLDRKPVIEMLENNFSLIFMMFPEKSKKDFYRDNSIKSMIMEIKYKRQKSQYAYDVNFGQVSKIFDKKGGRNLVITINLKDHLAPDIINFNQNNLNLRFEKLTQ